MTVEVPEIKSNPKKPTRRDVLRIGCIGAIVLGAGAAGILSQTDFMDRIQGVTHTPLLDNPAAWTYANNTLTLTLKNIPELNQAGSAVRLEAETVPENLLIVHGVDDNYYVYVNACTHSGRKIDLDANGQLMCTSVGRSTFDYAGEMLAGPAKGPLPTYTVEQTDEELIIRLV